VPSALKHLHKFTSARIGLGRAGTSLPTAPHLEFQLAHARARDAVHHVLDVRALQGALGQRGLENIALHSAAADRPCYLQRPDLGRRLAATSQEALRACTTINGSDPDIAFVIADGLSALAIEGNAIPFLDMLLPKLAEPEWRVAPIVVVEQGRVAVGDEVGELLRAQIVVILIGERPGLSAADSMGIYLTYQPAVGITDACRNCISNVRPGGTGYQVAADKLFYLLSESRRRRLSGVMLKELAALPNQDVAVPSRNFLLGEE
jgi:ethanolamine ammonia-lyase small subunit